MLFSSLMKNVPTYVLRMNVSRNISYRKPQYYILLCCPIISTTHTRTHTHTHTHTHIYIYIYISMQFGNKSRFDNHGCQMIKDLKHP